MKILIFGDSITHGAWDFDKGGWAQRLKLFLSKKGYADDGKDYNVYNLGLSGDTTKGLLERFEFETKQRIDEDEKILFIFAIGINDTQFLHDKNKIKVRLDEFKNNIRDIIKKAQVFSSDMVFLGLTPVDEVKTTPISWNLNKSYKNDTIKEFNRSLREICKKEEVLFTELLNEFQQEDYKALLKDGLYPTTKGHEKIFKTVKNFLLKK